ncbi:uncharacterized protein PRCAT00002601001 [Priceomyces carsonii]|uniref:uncharacterized protein n=1 Tax=Priceomyces carsonii TaxID=28549 RepID=UPI002ED8C574|nr:unnamed protein product [Priceomyces carsonii]
MSRSKINYNTVQDNIMAAPGLIELIQNGNLHRRVKDSVYDENLAKSYQELVEKTGLTSTDDIKFDPSKHLKYYSEDPIDKHSFHNTRRLTMEELGLSNKNQISPIGVSDPFPLFTDEAVNIMKQEILKKEIFSKYARHCYNSTTGLDCNLRGYVKNGSEISTPFIYQAWTHPKTTELVSTMAGVELEVIMDYEIAHVNIGIKDPKVAEEEKLRNSDVASKSVGDSEEIPAIVGWHYDSYPFVCVLMLSDTSEMIGGETSLRMGDRGKVAIVPGPQSGSAAVLQGRLIEHIAPSPMGMTERITMVTSYRAKDPLVREDSVLSTVKPEINYGSRYNDFYPQWIQYRVDIMKKRLDYLNNNCKDDKGTFNKEFATSYLKEIEAFLRKTYEEMAVSSEEWQRSSKDTDF